MLQILALMFDARTDQDWDSFDQKMRKNKQTNKRNKENRKNLGRT